MTDKVSFTSMDHGTRAEYDLVFAHDAENAAQQANRVLAWLQMMDGDSPYRISRLDHCLQAATRAERDGADAETIACALLHDIGDSIAPSNHSQVAAALLRPYVSEQNYWVVEHHGLFQGYYWFHHYERDRDARDRFKDHPYYQACVDFCARWDQCSFDPDYATQPLEHFAPLVHDLFTRTPREYV
ncbi:MAG: HD domain-containing protein [Pseudomonadales bacterium]